MARDKAKYQVGDVVKLANDEGLDIAQESMGAIGTIIKVYDDNFSYDVRYDDHNVEHVAEYHIDELVVLRQSDPDYQRLYPYWH